MLLLARLHGEAVGCAALKFHGDAPAEVKRMWVAPTVRGIGLARRLLTAIEDQARAQHVPALRLETNQTSPRQLPCTAPPATSRSPPSTTNPSLTTGSRSISPRRLPVRMGGRVVSQSPVHERPLRSSSIRDADVMLVDHPRLQSPRRPAEAGLTRSDAGWPSSKAATTRCWPPAAPPKLYAPQFVRRSRTTPARLPAKTRAMRRNLIARVAPPAARNPQSS